MYQDYFVERYVADRQSELLRVSLEVRVASVSAVSQARAAGGRPRLVVWVGLRLARIGAKLAGMSVDFPRTVRDLERI